MCEINITVFALSVSDYKQRVYKFEILKRHDTLYFSTKFKCNDVIRATNVSFFQVNTNVGVFKATVRNSKICRVPLYLWHKCHKHNNVSLISLTCTYTGKRNYLHKHFHCELCGNGYSSLRISKTMHNAYDS